MSNQWDYRIRAFYPPNRGGGVAIETTHKGEASRDAEIAAFRARMARGEIAYIEVVSTDDPFNVMKLYK